MEHSKTLARRTHSEAFRAQVLSECSQPGASVAAIALAHGLNANLVVAADANLTQGAENR
jgi:transposase